MLPALLAVALLLPAAALAAPGDTAVAGAPGGADVLVLAAEEEGGGGADVPQGPEPRDPHDTENPAAPDRYEAPFIWAASVGLLALAVLGTLTLAGLYYLLVQRPRQKSADRK